jgi:nicotinamide-nucleotide amidase
MVGIGESAVDEIAAPIYKVCENPSTTILASLGEIQLHITGAAPTESEAQGRVDALCAQLERALATYIFSSNGDSLEQVVAKALIAGNASLAIAESCTGGLVGQRITSVPGSSAFFWGGAICYSNAAKMEYLDVPHALLEQHGAVSAPVARALAEGARNRANATFGLGITGIAGPDGGTPEKPAGLVFIALAGPQETTVVEKRFLGDRDLVRWQASQIALDLIRRAMK